MDKKDCNCGNNDNNVSTNVAAQQVAQEPVTHCDRTFNQIVTGVAEVVVTPRIQTIGVRSHCMGEPVFLTEEFPTLEQALEQECSFVVGQRICTEADIRFAADVNVGQTGLLCGTPGTGHCSEPPVQTCTHSLDYYIENNMLVDQLIGQAGGSINLGPADQSGLTVVATTANAEAILGLNPPAPAPQSGVFKNHYAELYAQLLVAHLNMLRGATCKYITAAIQGADAFIGSSPTGGKLGASFVSQALVLYNKGLAPDCAGRCS